MKNVTKTIKQTTLSLLYLLFVITALSSKAGESAKVYTINSPDRHIQLEVQATESGANYSVKVDGVKVITSSKLAIQLESARLSKLRINREEFTSNNEVIKMVWGQFSKVRNHYSSLILNYNDVNDPTQQLRIEFKVFNDGLGFRYVIAAQGADTLVSEQSEFNFVNDYQANSYLGENAPLVTDSLTAVKTLNTPVRLMPTKGLHIAIHEAALIDGSPMQLIQSKKVEYGLQVSKVSPEYFVDNHSTSWRVVYLSANPSDFLTSSLLTNLSPPSVIKDTSWIKPGKSFWDWRVRGDKYGDGQVYDINYDSLHHFISGAETNQVDYIMIDANWYGAEHKATSDPYTEKPGLNIRKLIREAKDKGIGFILYVNDKASYYHDLNKLFETYSAWGAAGIKYGFMKASGQEKVRKTLKVVQLAAKHKLLINFHDSPIAPTGLRRTYPNWLTREYVHAQTDSGRSFTPSDFLAMMNLNMIAGPLDMSNGFFKLDDLVARRNYVRNEIYTTVAGEVARTLITFSGLIILPDSPESYESKSDLFEFIKNMPATWDESKVLVNQLGEVLVIARRSGDDWFVGVANNESAKTLELPLTFLSNQFDYDARIYADKATTHFEKQRETYQVKRRTLTDNDSLSMFLAAGGGQAVWLKAIK